MQQHSQHFNLSREAKQKLEQLTSKRYPGKKRRQSQVVEDLITQAFVKEHEMSTIATTMQEPEPDWLAPLTHEVLNLAQQEAYHLKATEVIPEHLLLGLIEQCEEGVSNVLTTLHVDASTMRQHLDNLLSSEQQWHATEGQSMQQAWRGRREELREELLNELKPGQVRRGIVRLLANFGAFVDLGGVEGLVHNSQLALSHVNHPSEVLHVGQEVQVQVLNVDKAKKKIALSLKRVELDPLTEADMQRGEGEIGKLIATDVETVREPLPLSSESQASLHGSLWIAMHMQSALVQPEHLFLSILQNRRIQDLLAPLLAFQEMPGSPMADLSQFASRQGKICPFCKRLVQLYWRHCVYCGQSLARVCPQCGASRVEIDGVRFCYECGSSLE